MLKGEEKKKYQRDYMRDYQKKKRSKQSPSGSKQPFIPYHIVEKLADEDWREKLTMLKIAFEDSHNPSYASNLNFCECGTPLSDVFEWLEKTPNV